MIDWTLNEPTNSTKRHVTLTRISSSIENRRKIDSIDNTTLEIIDFVFHEINTLTKFINLFMSDLSEVLYKISNSR